MAKHCQEHLLAHSPTRPMPSQNCHAATRLLSLQQLGAVFALATVAGSAGAGELSNFADAALQNDAQLKIAESQYQSLQANSSLAASALKPTVGVAAGLQETTITNASSQSSTIVSSPSGGSSVISGGNQSYQSTSYGASLQQPLFDWEAIQSYRKSEADSDSGALSYASARQNLFFRVVDAYFTVLSAQSTLEADQNLVLSNQRELTRQQKYQLAGLGTSTDVLTAQAALNSAQNQVIADSSSKEAADNALALITGLPLTASRILRDDIPLLPPQPLSIDSWTQLALANNPDIAAGAKALVAAKLGHKAVYGGFMPKVNGVGGYSSNKTDTANGNDNSSYYFGVSLALPLYSGGATSAKLRQAEANDSAAQAKYDYTQKQLILNVKLHFNNILAGIDSVKTALSAVQANEANVVAYEASAKAGARSVTDSLIARSNLAIAQKTYTNAKLLYLRSWSALKQDAGQLNSQHVGYLDAFLVDKKTY